MLWRSAPPPARRPLGFIEPCLPTLADTVPSGPQWADRDGARWVPLHLPTRRRARARVLAAWPRLDRPRTGSHEGVAALRVKSVTIDGEGVVCGEDGVADFDRLRAAVGRMGSRDAFLYAFDLLEINGTRPAPRRLGTCGGRRWQAYCAKPAKAFGCPSIWTAPTAPLCFGTLAQWAWRASSPSAGTGRIRSGRCAEWIKVKNRMHRRRRGSSTDDLGTVPTSAMRRNKK